MKEVLSQLNTLTQEVENFSAFDTLEHINFQANNIVSAIEELPESEVLQEVKKGILNLVSNCQNALEAQAAGAKKGLSKENSLCNPKLIELQEKVDLSDLQKQKMHSAYQTRLKEIDQELDEIIFELKNKYKKQAELGNILDNIDEEVEEAKSGEWEIQNDSEESSGPPSSLEGSALALYHKLHDLRTKIHQYKQLDLDSSQPHQSSLDKAFLGSLPISMKSVSYNSSEKVNNLLKGLKSRDSSLLSKSLEPEDSKSSYPDRSSLVGIVFDSSKEMSWQQKEKLIMTIMDQEDFRGKDVCLDDLLNITGSNGQTDLSFEAIQKKEDTSLSCSSLANFLHEYYSQHTEETFKCLKDLTEELLKDKENIKQSEKPQHSLNSSKSPFFPKIHESSISNISSLSNFPDLVSSFANSFKESERGRSKHKKEDCSLPKRRNYSEKEESNSIFPPLNSYCEEKSSKKHPLPPSRPPSDPPKKRFISARGFRKQSSNKKDISKFRFNRFKEAQRPALHVLSPLEHYPQEPM